LTVDAIRGASKGTSITISGDVPMRSGSSIKVSSLANVRTGKAIQTARIQARQILTAFLSIFINPHPPKNLYNLIMQLDESFRIWFPDIS